MPSAGFELAIPAIEWPDLSIRQHRHQERHLEVLEWPSKKGQLVSSLIPATVYSGNNRVQVAAGTGTYSSISYSHVDINMFNFLAF
jgi:hypothetical protein